ncbi:hypothetical protein [Opitutus terrae]|uniref:Uncharacterized protein n=1 Tax=Opitutus terrae (strain DSM 11246 / JCM 15787 / PB90-1) TaxID=452637 RepID=B1ZTY6_OPITP|nr:hypothetical protein [Opitutus terrae]ACB75868.1 hypothetical protein Oter_2586 [Opitutus terrae PB90-1]
MRFFPCLLSSLSVVAFLAAGCGDSSVVSYRIPKEAARAAQPESPHAGMSAGAGMSAAAVDSAGGPALAWTAPAHWRTKPGSSVRKGSYAIGDEASPMADLAITAFPGDVGGDLANVNRWRAQLQLPPIGADELPTMLTHLDHDGLHMNVVELVNGQGAEAMRLLSAIVPFAGATWFFKLTGPSELVAAEKAAFLEFLGTIKPAAPNADTPGGAATVNDPHAGLDLTSSTAAPPIAGSDMANTAVTTADGPGLKWTAPAHWETKTGSTMRKGSYLVKGEGDEAADLSITAFPGDVGGELANVNRWRNQLQLPPLDAAALGSAVTRQQSNGLSLTIVDLAGAGGASGQRMLGAIVPYAGATWFFKLTGPDALVSREKPAFLSFLNTVQTP